VLHENRYRLRFGLARHSNNSSNSARFQFLRNGFLQLTPSHPSPFSLADAATGDVFTVSQVLAPVATPEWALQLEDIGFLPGERVAIMARGMPGGDPLVVRVGLSTFALRLDEAACIQVRPVMAGAAA
jgi:ferrous iron transport protein A